MTSPADYGPHMWYALHAFAGNATEEPKRIAFARWMKILPEVFPCEVCASHLKQTMKAYPIEQYMGSADDLLRYTYIVHDSANNYWNASNPTLKRKTSPRWEDVRDIFLSLPSPAAVVPAPVAKSIVPTPAKKVVPTSSSQVTVSHPAFQQLKVNFNTKSRKW